MVFEAETASSGLMLATTSAKKEIIQASLTIIISNMIRMRFCTGLFFPSGIETEIFSAPMTELKEVFVKNCAADLTVTHLHPGYNPSRPPFREGRRSIIPPFIKPACR